MTRLRIETVERIECDNPECVVYVDELMREEHDAAGNVKVELVEHVVAIGWTQVDDTHFCPAHGG
jgi:hypothetical protein